MSDRAGDVWSSYEGTDAALYQIQIEHAARPSVTFGLREAFNAFLKHANGKSEEIPSLLDNLASSGIRLVISDKQDPDGVGFVQWRCGFYCAGDEGALSNFMCLLDQFISWKAHQLAKDVEVHVHPHSSVEDIACEDALELEYKHYVHHDAASKGLPLKWCECQPVIGKKVVTMEATEENPLTLPTTHTRVGPVGVGIVTQVQPVSDQVVSFLWMGQTWSFRSALDAADIRGAYCEASGEGDNLQTGRQYYRTCQVDLAGEQSKIKDVITEIFHNLAMRVKVRHAPEEGSAVAALITELRGLDNLFFEDDP